MTSLSAFPAGNSPTLSPLSSSAAEALLSRARRLSSKANKKTQSPTSFAEGEDPAALSTSYSSATSSNSHLHQLHRNSFNTYIREQNKKRSSHQHHRLSSTSTAKSTDESPSSPVSPCPLKPLSDSTPSELEHTHTPSAVVVISLSEDDNKQESLGQPQEDQPQQQTQQQTQAEQQESGAAIITACADPVNNNNNDHNSDYNSGSTEPSTSTCSLTVVIRPRALTLDSAQKTESTAANTNTPSTTTTTFSSTTSIVITDTTTSSNLTTPVEKHRRHQSENGTHSGLVHGILEALRDEPESKVLSSSNQEEHKDSGVIMTSATTSTQGLAQSVAQGHSETRQEATTAGSSSTLVISSNEGSSEVHGSSLPSLGANAIIAPSPNVFLSADEGAKDDKEQPPLPIQTESAPAPAAKTAAKTAADKAPQRLSINTSTAIIPPRSSSVLESGVPTAKTPTDTPINPAATSASSNSLLSPVTPSKKSRRSSNLLGKLVPKFLQTSFAAGSGGGSGSSPRSAHPSTSSLSKASTPLVTRPTRSSTFSGSESTSEAAKNTTLPALPMIPPLILETNEMEIRSPDATSPTAVAEPEAYLECLRSDSGIPTPPLSARRSSCSSDVSKRSNLSMVYSMSSVDPAESSSRIEGIAEEKSEDLARQEKQQLKEQEPEQEPAHSPYTIDENCDDDFFLNSVLRRSRSTHRHQQQQQSPHLSSISTTWMSSTPTLSGTVSQSSSVTGSPTSPVASPSVLSSSPQSHHFRSYSTPAAGSPIVVGLDEKRSRLHDAVGEWRRATNASSPIYTHSPSTSFSN